jgi:hypothetical protein
MSQIFDNWYVRVSGQSYGPYTDELMRRFVNEGRITPASEISADPKAGFFAAQRYAEFRDWQGGERRQEQPRESVSSQPVNRHLVMAELRSGQSLNFLRQMQSYMQCSRIGDTVWLVDGAQSTEALTDALRATVTPSDRLFIVDITGQEPGQHGFMDMSRSA